MILLPLLLSSFTVSPEAFEAAPVLEPTLYPVSFQDEPAAPEWTGSVTGGVTWTTGNTETTDVSASADATRESDDDRWSANLWWNYSSQAVVAPGLPTDSQVTRRNFGGKTQYDRFMSEKSYWYANAYAERNDRAGLQHRAASGLGGGYQFKDDEKFKFNGEAGLSLVSEDLIGASPNEYVSARAAYNSTYVVSETTTLEHDAEILPSLKDSKDWNTRFDTRLKVTMTENMFLQVQHVLAYDNTPAAGAAPADNQLIISVGWNF